MKLAHFVSLLVATAWIDQAAGQSTCPACNACNVQPIVKTGSVGPLRPGQNFPDVPVEQFDASLGTLTGVQISVRIELLGRRYDWENKAAWPCPGSYNDPDYFHNTTVDVMNPADSTVVAHVGPQETHLEGTVPATTAFDGCEDFGVCPNEPPPPAECCPGCPIPHGSGRDGGDCWPQVTMSQGSGYHHTFADQTFTFTTPCLTNNLGAFSGQAGASVIVPVAAIALENSGSLSCGNTSKKWNSKARVTVGITYTYCPNAPLGSCPICLGDSSSPASCPCSNTGLPGHGCNNSVSTGGAILSAGGTTNPDTVVLTSSYELDSALSIFVQGDSILAHPTPFGDGLRCIGGSLLRLYVKHAVGGTVSAPEGGDPSITARSASLGDTIAPGSTRGYQVFYRDPNFTFCPEPQGSTWNASSGLTIAW